MPYDLASAKRTAAVEAKNMIDLSAGSTSNTVDAAAVRIADNPDLDDFDKAALLAQLRANVGAAVKATLGGGKLPAMGGSPIVTGGDEALKQRIGELEEELETANAANGDLIKDRKVLERIMAAVNSVLSTKIPVPAKTSDPFPDDMPKRVHDALTADIQASKDAKVKAEADLAEANKKIADYEASGAPDKTKLETAFNGVLDAADNLSARTTMSGPKVTGVDELKTKVGKLKTVVGL